MSYNYPAHHRYNSEYSGADYSTRYNSEYNGADYSNYNDYGHGHGYSSSFSGGGGGERSRGSRSAHDENAQIWSATTIWYLDGPGRFIKAPPESIKYNCEDVETTGTQRAEEESSPSSPAPCSSLPSAEISVINEDTFVIAERCVEQGFNPMVLNMANATQPGGGVYKGSMAQEEDLFRRSDYFLAAPAKHYPLKPLEVLYSPRVTVYLDKHYQILGTVQAYACLACAAERDPRTLLNPLDPQNDFNRLYENPETAETTRKKILTIFRIGIDQGHDCLVLGSLGCGAFNNPQMRIIEYFNEGIRKYRHYFRKIVFAVLSKNDPNFDLFEEYIDPEAPAP